MKKPTGRPEVPDELRRDHVVKAQLTSSEAESVKQAAEASELPVSIYLRRLILAAVRGDTTRRSAA